VFDRRLWLLTRAVLYLFLERRVFLAGFSKRAKLSQSRYAALMYVELRIANAPTKLLEALGAMDAALAVTILQAIATTIIGAIALYFARMQALTGRTQAATNQKEFRLRFFDRRIGVYDAVMELCACIAKTGTVNQQQLSAYARKTREASFFFNDEIQAVCDELYKKAITLMTAHQIMDTAPQLPNHEQTVKTWGDLAEWFSEQPTKTIKPRFESFLRIRE
jgi:hypothetical protein